MPKLQKQHEIPSKTANFDWKKKDLCLLRAVVCRERRYFKAN
jgi:hypothetical protein